MSRQINLFSLADDGSINVESVPAEDVVNSDDSDLITGYDDVMSELEGGVLDGDDVIVDDVSGDLVETETEASESVPEDSGMDIPINPDGSVPVALSEELTQALYALAPAPGSIGSTTLDYFDRVCSGLDDGSVYVAYRTDSSNSTNAVLFFGESVSVKDGIATFGKGSERLEVVRDSSNYSSTTYYYRDSAEGATVDFGSAADESVIYYTNASPGYPLLGNLKPRSGNPAISTILIGVLAVCVVFGLFRRKLL